MSSFSFRRAVLALVLGLSLVSSWASASELRGRAADRPARTVAQEVQGVFGSVWGMVVRAWSKAGGSADPDGGGSGQADSASSATFCDNGASADPFGRCSPGHNLSGSAAVTGSAVFCDNGASADPNGRCSSGH